MKQVIDWIATERQDIPRIKQSPLMKSILLIIMVQCIRWIRYKKVHQTMNAIKFVLIELRVVC